MKAEETTVEAENSPSGIFPISWSILCMLFRSIDGDFSLGLRRQGTEEKQEEKSASGRKRKNLFLMEKMKAPLPVWWSKFIPSMWFRSWEQV